MGRRRLSLAMVWIGLSCGNEGTEPQPIPSSDSTVELSSSPPAVGSTSSGPAQETVPSMTTSASSLPLTAESLYEEIDKADPRANWTFFPGHDWPRPGTSVHGSGLEYVYVNPASSGALEPGMTGALPEGTTIVKYITSGTEASKPGDVVILAAMKKQSGANPEADDWVFAEWDGQGRLIAEEFSGKGGTCTSCHDAAQRDYVWLAK